MSQQLINHSPDLKRLRDEGYNIEVRQSGHLLVKDVPYVTSNKEVKTGMLVSTLNLAGNVTAAPDTHVAMFIGEYPCDANGAPLEQIRHSGRQELAPGLVVDHSFSAKPKPKDRYDDYYDKVTAYIAILLTHAHVINPEATAQTFPVITTEEGESVFKYIDTATSRAGINVPAKKLELTKVAIVGVGGTGSYVFDLVAKTPVKEIHLFDGDVFLSHNAFRAPSAASVDELVAKQKKVVYWTEMYSKMRRGIVAHSYHVDESNVAELQTMDFVFLCVDAGAAKKVIVESLERFGRRFVDVGMGIELVDDALRGVLRVTTSTPDRRDHFRTRVSLAQAITNDDYDSNIQVADLNALNAAMAVIRWKKLCGFYLDFEHEHHSTYSIDCGMLTNDDQHEKPLAQA